MENVAAIAVTGLLFIGIWLFARRNKQQQQEGLTFASSMLEGSVMTEVEKEVSGRHEGLDVTFRYSVRGTGKSSTQWTEIDVSLGQIDVTLELRREGFSERRAIERGHAHDFETGHAAFDDAFVVEGAPAEVIELALDETTCALLMGLTSQPRGAIRAPTGGVLRLEVQHFLVEPASIEQHVEMATELAERLREAHAYVDEEAGPSDVGTPYRGAPDMAGVRGARDARRAEVTKVREMRVAREARNKSMGLYVMLAFGAIVVAILVQSLIR